MNPSKYRRFEFEKKLFLSPFFCHKRTSNPLWNKTNSAKLRMVVLVGQFVDNTWVLFDTVAVTTIWKYTKIRSIRTPPRTLRKIFDVFAATGAINWSYWDTLAPVRDCFYILIPIIRTHLADIKLTFPSNKVSRNEHLCHDLFTRRDAVVL